MKHQYIRQKNIRQKIKWMLVLLMAVSLSACGVKEEKNRQQAEENSAEESIRRRGGEGHLVTKAFIERFNNEINKFLPMVPIKQEMLNTCGMSTSQVHDWMLETIESGYSAFKTQMMG